MSWQELVHKKLDDFERGACKESFSIQALAELAQRSRSTIWRSKDIRERVNALRESGTLTEREKRRAPARASLRQIERRLRIENKRMAKEINVHLVNYVVIFKRLHERGIDPAPIMEGLETAGESKACKLLQW